MTVPYWVQDSIFYQIFPDRFANGDLSNDPANLVPWGSPPDLYSFHGGDLRGIIQQFDYLLDLGVNALYLNPIFQASSTHRYNTTDFFRIDPKLGTQDDFIALLKVAHDNGVKVIIDGVFNHVGRGFFAFNDVLENQENSPYKDWFFIQRFPVDAYTENLEPDYQCWWKFKSLPKLNFNNPAVRHYILSVVKYWTELGIDGWRLDVPNEIPNRDFWNEFRETVLAINKDAYMVGEIWEVEPSWVGDKAFDGLMNYPLREAILGYVSGHMMAINFANRIETISSVYPKTNFYSMFNTLGSHDTDRVMSVLKGNPAKVKLASLMLFAFPGAPAIYYGDEIGMEGGKDPDNRRAFPWNLEAWNMDTHQWYQMLISLRKRYPALRRGSFTRILLDESRGAYAFVRKLSDQAVLIATNASTTRKVLRVPMEKTGWRDGRIVHNLLGDEEYMVGGDDLIVPLPPNSGVWIG
jgi:neopullulanase